MDAALNWFAMLQGYPDDRQLKADFEKWRRADPANARAFAEVAGVWDFAELDVIADDIGSTVARPLTAGDGALVPFARPRRNVWTHAMIAAAAVIMVAVGIQQYPVMMLNWRADYQTAAGVREEITLPDGSLMTLNTASAVSLDFEGEMRSVTLLQGEAYFDVVPDASRPFTVAAAFSKVEVKGTAFAVRTDSDKDTVVLERGLVDVTRLTARNDMAALQPGESVTATATALSMVRNADPATALSWRDGRLVFENQPFVQVLEEIGRYYGNSIIVANDRVGRARVTGNYRLDNPERTIRSLAATIGGSVTRIPGGILILR
ncbi:FecR family protein [Mesorhizobium sp. SB112]|uniref:FecR family protein n=1 Tax=Mesorhizobium sp. SB112 TaxID=3151853 RepID=UPI003262FAA8